MKTLVLILCMTLVIALAGCEDTYSGATGNNNNGGNAGNNGGGGGGGTNPTANLKTFALNNCNAATNGEPMAINGASFPPSATEDPTQSIYTRNCLNQ